MTKLSDDILDAIDGSEERRGRDARLTEWVERARKLERDAERYQWLKSKPGLRVTWPLSFSMERTGRREIWDAVMDDAIDADMAEQPAQRFTDGHGNDISHLVDGKVR